MIFENMNWQHFGLLFTKGFFYIFHQISSFRTWYVEGSFWGLKVVDADTMDFII
jgi:hypothetical protein